MMVVSADNGSAIENSTCDISGTNLNGSVQSNDLMEHNEGTRATNIELASKSDFRTPETTSKTSFFESYGNDAAGNSGNTLRTFAEDEAVLQEGRAVRGSVDKETTDISATRMVTLVAEGGNNGARNSVSTTSTIAKDGAVSQVFSQEGLAISEVVDKEEIPGARLSAESGSVLPAENEVRCIQCHKTQPPQICPVCSRTFASLPDHIGSHAGKNPYNISALLGIQTTYVDQYAEQREPEPIQREDKGVGDGGRISEKGDSELRPQKKTKKQQQCNECGGTFAKLAEHMARVHSTGEACMCTDCGKFLRNATTLRVHIASKTCQKSHVCTVCERSFKNDGALKSHVRSHACADQGTDGQHTCKKCRHPFQTSEELKSHISDHSCGKCYPCCVCGKTFADSHKLKLHERLHSGETPFECAVCGKCFRTRVRLTEHMTLHTMEKRYVCTTCGQRFRLRRSLERHRVIHSGVKRYQ